MLGRKETEKDTKSDAEALAAETRDARNAKAKKGTIYVVHQNLPNTNTTSVYGTFIDKEAAERAVSQARAGGLTATREATYFIQEVQAEEVAKEVQPGPGRAPADSSMAVGATPVAGITFSDSGEALNVPNKQLPRDEDDPHTRGLKAAVLAAREKEAEDAKAPAKSGKK